MSLVDVKHHVATESPHDAGREDYPHYIRENPKRKEVEWGVVPDGAAVAEILLGAVEDRFGERGGGAGIPDQGGGAGRERGCADVGAYEVREVCECFEEVEDRGGTGEAIAVFKRFDAIHVVDHPV